MVFHSPNFLVFMLLLLIPYYMWKKGRISLLVIANAIFYGASGLGVLLLFMAITGITFVIMHAMRRPRWRFLFWVGIAVVAGNLIFFKYALFLLSSLEVVLHRELLLTDAARQWLTGSDGSLILPIGISFYSFQFISYLIDVRRGVTEPTPNLFRFWVYMAVFPQLVAGPIMRGNELIPQLDKLQEKRISWQEVRYGLYLIFVGLLKKVTLADNLETLVNPLYADVAALTPEQAWLAAYLFGFQIYFDFSAYSDMAMGLGILLGFRLIINFRTPYLSSNPSEFWRRWHISLSRWIRDYIYIGLGGNRKGRWRTYVNLFAAMLISGIWHGAAWHFVVWGALHGLLLALYRLTLGLNRIAWVAKLRASAWYRVLAVVVFFQIVSWTWVFFRAQTVGEAWFMTRLMVQADPLVLVSHPLSLLVAGLYALHLLEWWMREREPMADRVWHAVPALVRGAVYVALILVIFLGMKGETYDFIYFQF